MKFIKILLYGGAEKDEYDRIEGDIWKENRKNMRVFCAIYTVIVTAMCLLAYTSDKYSNSYRLFFVISAIFMAAMFLLFMIMPARKKLMTPMLDLLLAFIYAGGIYNACVLDTDRPAVFFVVFLVFMPQIISGRPISMFIRNTIAYAGFIYFNVIYCRGKFLYLNIINATIFGILILIFASFSMSRNIRRYIDEDKLRYISDIDLLTGLNNRNSYERNLEYIEQACKEELNCIYIDMNGLHELNNTKGHEAGDIALRNLAAGLKHKFWQSGIYRIGGDEFVIFIADKETSDILEAMDECRQKLSEEGVSFAYGVHNQKKAELDMSALVNGAEKQMFEAKEAAYKESGVIHR